MKIESVSSKYLSAAFKAMSLIVLIMLTVQLFTVYKYYSKHNFQNKRDLSSAVATYNQEISEKISILTNNPLFIDYLRSGAISRERLDLDLQILFSSIHETTIAGYSLESIDSVVFFDQGSITDANVRLRLCYLENIIDSRYGKCIAYLRIYFNKALIVEKLKNINQNLVICKSCKVNLLGQESMLGSFQAFAYKPINLNVMIDNSDDMVIFYIMEVLFLISIALVFTILHSTVKKVSEKYIYSPIKNLASSFKMGNKSTLDHFSIFEIRYLAEALNNFIDSSKESELLRNRASLGELARQVAHDIRSPLAALDMVLLDMKEVSSSEKELVIHAIKRIHDIANNLLSESEQRASQKMLTGNQLLGPILESLISEKRTQYKKNKNLEIELFHPSKELGVFVDIDVPHFKRAISNLVNNAVESIEKDNGKIIINYEIVKNSIQIQISDNGKGIPPHVLKDLLILPHSIDKVGGNGIGLASAKHTIERDLGTISISSYQNEGTTVYITLPKKEKPAWFCDSLSIRRNQKIVVIDDDKSIYELWKKKMSLLELNFPISYFNDFPFECNKESLYLVDYDLGNFGYNGLQKIIELNLSNCFLVTSNFENQNIQNLVLENSIQIIPKSLISKIPISVID